MDERQFQDVFKELRIEKNMSQDSIAKELDVSPALISKWENGLSTPAPEMLEYIADYFDVSIDYLVGRTNDRRWFKNNNDMKIQNNLYEELKKLPRTEQILALQLIRNIVAHYKLEDSDK